VRDRKKKIVYKMTSRVSLSSSFVPVYTHSSLSTIRTAFARHSINTLKLPFTSGLPHPFIGHLHDPCRRYILRHPEAPLASSSCLQRIPAHQVAVSQPEAPGWRGVPSESPLPGIRSTSLATSSRADCVTRLRQLHLRAGLRNDVVDKHRRSISSGKSLASRLLGALLLGTRASKHDRTNSSFNFTVD
jgi:hypothetical protein